MFAVPIVLAVLVLLLVVGVAIVQRRDPRQADAAALTVLGWVSLCVALAITAMTVVQAWLTLDRRRPTEVTVPVVETWPSPAPGITVQNPPSATRVAGGFTQADLSVTGLSTGTRALLAGGGVLTSAVMVVLALLLALLCRRLVAAQPFAPTLQRLGMVAAIVVLVAGMGGQVLTGVGRIRASHEALFISGWASKGPAGTDVVNAGMPQDAFYLLISFWPVALALGLAGLSELVRRGVSLSTRADRLADETATLREDTRGLV